MFFVILLAYGVKLVLLPTSAFAINCGSFDSDLQETCGSEDSPEYRCYTENDDGKREFVSCNDPDYFACIGGIGTGCGLYGTPKGHYDIPCRDGEDPDHPWIMLCPVSVGSILHDECCAQNWETVARGCRGANYPTFKNPKLIELCAAPWYEAANTVASRQQVFYWFAPFDTRRRYRNDSRELLTLSQHETLAALHLTAPADQKLGPPPLIPIATGPQFSLIPIKRAIKQRSARTWGQFCESDAAGSEKASILHPLRPRVFRCSP